MLLYRQMDKTNTRGRADVIKLDGVKEDYKNWLAAMGDDATPSELLAALVDLAHRATAAAHDDVHGLGNTDLSHAYYSGMATAWEDILVLLVLTLHANKPED